MVEFWDIIVKTNTFNFAILLIIFAIVFVKLNVPQILENIKNDIASTINNARTEKDLAEKELKQTTKLVKNTDKEIEEKLNIAKLNAKTLVNNINKVTKEQIKHIENNVARAIDSEEKKVNNELSNNTINSAIELAKKTLINKLKEDKSLHSKLLDKSIEEIRNI